MGTPEGSFPSIQARVEGRLCHAPRTWTSRPRANASEASMFEDLLRRAKAGDPAAYEGLLVPFLPALLAFARSRMSPAIARRESAEDLVQSVCREVVGSLGSIRAEDEVGFRSWLFGVMHNKLHSKETFHRAHRRDVELELHASVAGTRIEDLLQAYRGAATPSQDAVALEEVARIEAAFRKLPEPYGDALRLVTVAGLSYAQAGALLNRSQNSVRQLVHRARARLATYLDEPHDSDEG